MGPVIVTSTLRGNTVRRASAFMYSKSRAFKSAVVGYTICPDTRNARALKRMVTGSYGSTVVRVNTGVKTARFVGTRDLFGFKAEAKVSLPGRNTNVVRAGSDVKRARLTYSTFKRNFAYAVVRRVGTVDSIVGNKCCCRPRLIAGILSDGNKAMGAVSPVLLGRAVSSEVSDSVEDCVTLDMRRNADHRSGIRNCDSNNGANATRGCPQKGKGCLISFVKFTPMSSPTIMVCMIMSRPGTRSRTGDACPRCVTRKVLSRLLPCLGMIPSRSRSKAIPRARL